jgi:thiamine phosphate synthase YjbQ (UPF0047 family)
MAARASTVRGMSVVCHKALILVNAMYITASVLINDYERGLHAD